MEYLFFDIECACVYKNVAKICVFGYVRTDEQLNIIEKKDILINPNGSFHLMDRGNKKGLVLPYEYETFKQYPMFPAVYDNIKNMLEREDCLVFGHSVLNDVNYLRLEVQRYKLVPLEFSFYDTQVMYMDNIGDFSRQYGLETINNELNIEFVAHKAVDDAFLTMRIAQELCAREGCTLKEFIEKHQIYAGKIDCISVTPCMSKKYVEYNEEKANIKRIHAKQKAGFVRYALRSRKQREGVFWGKTFIFSKALEVDDEDIKSLLKFIFLNGGRYSTKIDMANVYVPCDNDTSQRYENALKKKELGELEILTKQEIYSMGKKDGIT